MSFKSHVVSLTQDSIFAAEKAISSSLAGIGIELECTDLCHLIEKDIHASVNHLRVEPLRLEDAERAHTTMNDAVPLFSKLVGTWLKIENPDRRKLVEAEIDAFVDLTRVLLHAMCAIRHLKELEEGKVGQGGVPKEAQIQGRGFTMISFDEAPTDGPETIGEILARLFTRKKEGE